MSCWIDRTTSNIHGIGDNNNHNNNHNNNNGNRNNSHGTNFAQHTASDLISNTGALFSPTGVQYYSNPTSAPTNLRRKRKKKRATTTTTIGTPRLPIIEISEVSAPTSPLASPTTAPAGTTPGALPSDMGIFFAEPRAAQPTSPSSCISTSTTDISSTSNNNNKSGSGGDFFRLTSAPSSSSSESSSSPSSSSSTSSYTDSSQASIERGDPDGGRDHETEADSTVSLAIAELVITPNDSQSVSSISSYSTNGSSDAGSTSTGSAESDYTRHSSDISSYYNSKRAEYISATVYKENSSSHFGIGLKVSKRRQTLQIATMDSNGLLARSSFLPGDELLSINNMECKYMDAKTASEFLRSLPLKVPITFIVHNPGTNADKQMVESMVTKEKPDITTGITLKSASSSTASLVAATSTSQQGGVVIASIADNSVFEPSLLNVGDRILAVNRKSCKYLDTRSTANLIRKAPTTISMITQTTTETASAIAASNTGNGAETRRAKLLSATVYKSTKKTLLGIALKTKINVTINDRVLVIASISKQGLLAQSPFQVGDVLVSINNKKISRKNALDPKTAMSILQNLTGLVTLVCQSSTTSLKNSPMMNDWKAMDPSTLVEVMVLKPTPDYRVGLVLKKDVQGHVYLRNFEDVSNKITTTLTNSKKKKHNKKTTITTTTKKQPSLFAASPCLRPRDLIISINKVPVERLQLNIVANIIRNAPQHVTIVAQKSSISAPPAGSGITSEQ